MHRRTFAVAALCALLMSCDPLGRNEMTLAFDNSGENVRIKVTSDQRHIEVYHGGEGNRLGEDVLAERDEWSARFNAANATEERIVIGRTGHKITSIEDEGLVKTADLQRFFFDVGVTVQVIHGEGWTELTMFPGASTRATNRQRDLIRRRFEDYARVAAAYFEALRPIYTHLEANPSRAEEVFFAIYSDKTDETHVTDEERSLVDAFRKAAEALGEAGDKDEKDLERMADLVFNPFPAAVAVRVPSEPLAVEGFERKKDGALVAGTATPLEAIMKLEGRWVSPDPFAQLMRSEGVAPRELAARMAKETRKIVPVILASEIAEAIANGVKPADRYRVRWMKKPAKSSGS